MRYSDSKQTQYRKYRTLPLKGTIFKMLLSIQNIDWRPIIRFFLKKIIILTIKHAFDGGFNINCFFNVIRQNITCFFFYKKMYFPALQSIITTFQYIKIFICINATQFLKPLNVCYCQQYLPSHTQTFYLFEVKNQSQRKSNLILILIPIPK